MKAMVVYIDDESMLCELFQAFYEKPGREVVTFSDAEAARDYLNSTKVSVAFCDNRMPNLSGLDLVASLKDPPPFYLVSGEYCYDESDARFQQVIDVLLKPFKREEIEAILNRWCS